MENLKQTIADKDREVALLTGELQTLQAQLHGVGNWQLERQKEKEEEAIHRWMVETSELKAKLVKVEGEKQEGERQLEAIYRQREFLKRLVAELREKKCNVLQVDHYVSRVESAWTYVRPKSKDVVVLTLYSLSLQIRIQEKMPTSLCLQVHIHCVQ